MSVYIIHGTWIPIKSGGGEFHTWVETDEVQTGVKGSHPCHLTDIQLAPFFSKELGFKLPEVGRCRYFTLPSTAKQPLPSYGLLKYNSLEVPESFSWKMWAVDCLTVPDPLGFLKELHFLSIHFPVNIWLGEDLLFWYSFSKVLKGVIIKDQYIPALKCRANRLPSKKSRSSEKDSSYTFFSGWEILSHSFEEQLKEYAALMPAGCTAGKEAKSKKTAFYDPLSLLNRFSSQVLESMVRRTSFSKKLERQTAGTYVEHCLSDIADTAMPSNKNLTELWKKWYVWKRQLFDAGEKMAFFLCFRLKSADPENPGDWELEFLAESRKDPSLKLELARYWDSPEKPPPGGSIYDFVNDDFDRELLLKLGHAARIYPKLWEGLKSETPSGVVLSLDEAFGFLKESAFVLEDAGYKIIIPTWWTPEGKKNFKIKVKSSTSSSGAGSGRGFFSLNSVIEYQYDLSIGGETLSEKEWQLLVEAKTPLVHFRGEWIELDGERMTRMLEFWKNNRGGETSMSLGELLKRSGEEDEVFDFAFDEILSEIMGRLRGKGQYNLIDNITGFNGKLREYQKRGTSWLYYLESLGLNPCLADDMGLGKTIEVIALMVYERQLGKIEQPSLFIVPTSVIGNWKKEIERFAPGLSVLIHHGAGRLKTAADFKKVVTEYDAVITSFALVRKDEKIMRQVEWHRLVVDEAQNIKNPKAAQTKVIWKLPSRFRIALTGTPIENRLMDLWSLFHFLNPGYLSTPGSFRKNYELPIQKENDVRKSRILKKLVEPFILRRMKSDKDIISDLPDKVEQKVFCNLTREQASLYQAVVDDVVNTIETTEGIERKGLILSTLLRLKQICNHPGQYLQDGSGFTSERSHKLTRLSDMVSEIIDNEESLLIFSQFREIGTALEEYFITTNHFNTYLLHGGTSRKKREAMIEEFQDPSTGPSVFILSLKAGGVGITLTRANHVFHFDRWWNPAVENQATDRAYRIGQEKNVFVHKFVSLGTLEEKVDLMLEEKQKLSDSIISSDESWLSDLDNEAFRKLIRLNKEAVL